MVECDASNVETGVRFSYPAQIGKTKTASLGAVFVLETDLLQFRTSL